MYLPDSLASMLREGLIDEVVRPLMSGKEAQVYLVVAGGHERVAKIYKESKNRSFKHRSDYTEGRSVRNSRDARAMKKRSRYGIAKHEEAWRSAEVDAMFRLHAAGVRVPEPFDFVDGVLIMELVTDAHGHPAPRLAEVEFSRDEARRVFDHLLREVVRMLCAGLVHGDLSDFNVLMASDGPVIIDFPQAVDASRNQNAKKLLLRDVDNLNTFLRRFAPMTKGLKYGPEMWDAYERSCLAPDTQLTGRFLGVHGPANTLAVLEEIEAAQREEMERRAARGQAPSQRSRRGQNKPRRGADSSRRGAGKGQRTPDKSRGSNTDRRSAKDDRGGSNNDHRGSNNDHRGSNNDHRGSQDDRGGANRSRRGRNAARRAEGQMRGDSPAGQGGPQEGGRASNRGHGGASPKRGNPNGPGRTGPAHVDSQTDTPSDAAPESRPKRRRRSRNRRRRKPAP